MKKSQTREELQSELEERKNSVYGIIDCIRQQKVFNRIAVIEYELERKNFMEDQMVAIKGTDYEGLVVDDTTYKHLAMVEVVEPDSWVSQVICIEKCRLDYLR